MLMDDERNTVGSMAKRIAAVEAEAERLRQENLSLRESDALYRQLTEIAGHGIWALDSEGKTTFVNRAITEMLGYTEEEMIGRPLFAFIPEELWPAHRARLENYRYGGGRQFDTECRRKDGTPLWAIISTRPLFDREGLYLGAVAMITDITERKKVEAQLLRAQRLETAGQIAGQVAHDFNNLRRGSAQGHIPRDRIPRI